MVHCLCRRNGTGDMVSCDRCKEWFHFRCVNITNKEDLGDEWYCPLCSQLQALEESILEKCARNIDGKFAFYDERLKKLIDENRNSDALTKEVECELSKVSTENVSLKEKCEQFRVDLVQYQTKVEKLSEENRNSDALTKELECELSKVSTENVSLKEKCEQLGVDLVQYQAKVEKLSEENRTLNASMTELESKRSEVSSENASLKRKSAVLIKENEDLKVKCKQLQQNIKQTKENPTPSSSQSSNITNFSGKRRSLSLSKSQQTPNLKKNKQFIDDSD